MINFEAFQNVDLRVGTVVAAERVEGSDKLLKLRVDIGAAPEGLGERQIVAGIGKVYAPETILGKQIVIVANLEPRSLMGLESQGMLLAASSENGPVVLVPERIVSPGAKAK